MNSKGTRYSTEFKIKAVELSKSRNNLSTVASELNISYEILQRWHKAYDDVERYLYAKNVEKNLKPK